MERRTGGCKWLRMGGHQEGEAFAEEATVQCASLLVLCISAALPAWPSLAFLPHSCLLRLPQKCFSVCLVLLRFFSIRHVNTGSIPLPLSPPSIAPVSTSLCSHHGASLANTLTFIPYGCPLHLLNPAHVLVLWHSTLDGGSFLIHNSRLSHQSSAYHIPYGLLVNILKKKWQ